MLVSRAGLKENPVVGLRDTGCCTVMSTVSFAFIFHSSTFFYYTVVIKKSSSEKDDDK